MEPDTLVLDDNKKNEKKEVVLTPPACVEGKTSENIDRKAPNILQLIFSLFSNVRLGSDLTHFQLPPLLNSPKSQLQGYGEVVYCVNKDMLRKCAIGEITTDRMISVVAWSISTIRPVVFGAIPYNPILGETHLASRGTLNVLLEQVSHHPPVTALHATDESNNVELIWCQYATPKFYGTFVEGKIQGKRRLNLLEKGESYVMQSPNVEYRLLPKPGVVWVGNVNIKCQETGLEAHLSIKNGSFLGFGGANTENNIKGKIIDSSSSNKLYELHGRWDRTVYIKDMTDGKTKILYNAEETINALPTPILTNPEGVWESESAVVWAEVSKSIINKEWDKAREAKRSLEEKQRLLFKQRKSMGQDWTPKHFNLSHNPQFGWDCSPKQKFVPPAPISFPI